MKSVFFAISLAYNKKKQYLRPTPRHKEFYVLGVRDSSYLLPATIRCSSVCFFVSQKTSGKD